MNFQRTHVRAANPTSNRFIAAMVATFAALAFSIFGSGQWASADSGTTSPDHDPVVAATPGAPLHVTARPGDSAAAVVWIRPADDAHVSGYTVTADPSGISVETGSDSRLAIVEGLENGVEYTFTVVAFNDAGVGVVSDPSNPVIPEADLVLNEEQLKRLREHLRKLAHNAKERLDNAEGRARDRLDEIKDRVRDRLENKTERARDFIERVRDRADDRNGRQVDRARDWFDRLKERLQQRVERAEGTDRYEELRARADKALDKAQDKLVVRIEKSNERSDARIDKAEETARVRIEKARERADTTIERTEVRLTERIQSLQERLQDLLRRLARIWANATPDEG